MGQYYKAVLLAESNDDIVGYLESWDLDNGAKLMEHAWLGNNFVEAVEGLLSRPTRVVWAGDYADSEPTGSHNLYDKTDSATKAIIEEPARIGRYIINHDKRAFVDKDLIEANARAMRIHPLPVLTVEGNGRGFGDLHYDVVTGDFGAVGLWARDRITVADAAPKNYGQVLFDLIEHW